MAKTHDELAELLGAYALDAVTPEEAELVERHLPVCPRCRAEVAEHREVAGLLGYAGQEAPAGLWDRIASSMSEPPPEVLLSRLGGGEIVALDGGRFAGSPRRERRLHPSGGQRFTTVRLRTVAAVTAAAAVIVAVLGVQVARLSHRTSSLASAMAASGDAGPSMKVVQAALSTPGARKVTLTAMSPGDTVQAVVLPGGQGYLYDVHLSPLPSSETYQLWGIDGSEAVSYGLIGTVAERVVAFRAGAGVDALAVTAEVAGGVEHTTHAPVSAGQVTPPL